MFEDYPALTNAAKTAACGCGVCANCRAKAGSKDNMRVQDKNPKKVPVKDYEITGEDAWKGVPNVKTKEKKADNITPGPQIPQHHQDLSDRNRDYLRQGATTQSGHSWGDGEPLTAGGISAALGIPAAAFGLGGAGAGVLANLIRGKSLWRGAGTGALTGLGALAGGVGGGVAGTLAGPRFDGQGLGGPASTIGLGVGGLGGAGAGGYAGYQAAQSLFGDEEEKEKTAMLRKQAIGSLSIDWDKIGPMAQKFLGQTSGVATAAAPTALAALVGGGINALRGKSVLRGAGTGALTGLGATAGGAAGLLGGARAGEWWANRPEGTHIVDNINPENSRGTPHRSDDQNLNRVLGGAGVGAGAGIAGGGYGGYQLAQSLFGEEEEEPKTAMLRKQAVGGTGPPAIKEMQVDPVTGKRVPRAPAPAGPSWMEQAGDAAGNAWTGGKNLFGVEQAQGPPTAGGQGPGQAIRGGSLADYSSQAGQWLADKAGYGDQFKNLGAGWRAGLPALGGAAALGLGSYGLSRLFGGSDKEKEKTSAYIVRNYPVKQAAQSLLQKRAVGGTGQDWNYTPSNSPAKPPAPAPAGPSWMQQAGDAAGNAWNKGKDLFGVEQRSGWNPASWVGDADRIRGGSLADYSSQAGQWLADKIGQGDRFSGLSNTMRSGIPLALGGGALAAGSYGLSRLFGGSDKEKEKTSAYIVRNYPVKQAGIWSEQFSALNPLNLIGAPIGAAAAGFTPTRNMREQATSNIDDSWSNLLIPGKGAYNSMKRLGWAIRSPEMEAAEQDVEMDELVDAERKKRKAVAQIEDDGPQHPGDPGFEDKLKQHMDDNNLKYSAARDLLVCANALTKQGGYWSELLPSLIGSQIPGAQIPYVLGNLGGQVGAAFTPTKSIKEIAEQGSGWGKGTALNFAPGVGGYRIMKRLGTSTRGPEMKAMEEQIKRERAEDSSGTKRLSDNLQGIRSAIEAGAPGSLAKLQASGQEKEKAAAVQYLLSSASTLTR